ncbi:unnamed protein product [Phytomonas sp. Hart1]|nr:unnamed protein product [Phytomonas sp. Hart1]|eukprot:CCW70789.1 unnamed protein product [Phytomonas sp. isolate Hart1]
MVVAVVFSITFGNDDSAAAFLGAFQTMKRQVMAQEPGALLYELHQSVHEGRPVPRKFIVLERYNSRFDLEEVHQRSPAFAALQRELRALDVVAQSVEVLESGGIANGASPGRLEGEACPPEGGHPLLKKRVLVFGGSQSGRDPAYATEASRLGELLARREKRALVYGGGTFGMMGAIAKAVKREGGTVITVIPRPLCGHETSGDMIGDLVYYTDTMSERKSIMFACADVVVALPGGTGTFDELLEVITLYQLDAYRPKIGLLNVNGYFEPFLSLLKHMVTEGFTSDTVFSSIIVASTADALIDALNKYELPPLPENRLEWHVRP